MDMGKENLFKHWFIKEFTATTVLSMDDILHEYDRMKNTGELFDIYTKWERLYPELIQKKKIDISLAKRIGT